jgi:hypothetical protein
MGTQRAAAVQALQTVQAVVGVGVAVAVAVLEVGQQGVV